ncbi:ABC 3 transport family protein [Peptoniphilus sp. oral taxon 386 str. F0131]|nr:metal ABC transporter permease [Peptoniphilus sp. oral taxon 386]EFI41803.1 ABC 3 transport family protein [Peptoniphilus sp. oral taxon 386 str. F0131]
MLSGLWHYFLISYESLLVLSITSVTCALIGSFLVLRKLSMVSDAISHSVLLGIVIAFFITKDVSSPLLIVGAALFGVLTVFAIEMLSGTGLVDNDDAVGIVFPLFFALAVILITKFARNVHLDTDIVLMGEVIMAPINRVVVLGHSMPKALFQMSILFIVNLAFIIIFFKELKITTFDREFAIIAGFSSTILFYVLMTLSSMTAVVAFDAVGAILVVSFLITPGASSYLITKDLKKMILISCIYALINSILGYLFAMIFNVSMSGMTAAMAGLTFFLTFLFNRDGLITSIILRMKNKQNFRLDLMIMHIGNHIGEEGENEELGIDSIRNHLMWKQEEIEKHAKKLIEQGIIYIDKKDAEYKLTEKGYTIYDKIKSDYGM